MAIKLRLPALERTRGQGWPSLRARRRETCPQAVHSQVRLSSKKVRACGTRAKIRARWRRGEGHVEHRRTGTLLQPNVESVLRYRGMAGLAVIVIVRLGERGARSPGAAAAVSTQPSALADVQVHEGRAPVAPPGEGGQVNQMYPFPNSCV